MVSLLAMTIIVCGDAEEDKKALVQYLISHLSSEHSNVLNQISRLTQMWFLDRIGFYIIYMPNTAHCRAQLVGMEVHRVLVVSNNPTDYGTWCNANAMHIPIAGSRSPAKHLLRFAAGQVPSADLLRKIVGSRIYDYFPDLRPNTIGLANRKRWQWRSNRYI